MKNNEFLDKGNEALRKALNLVNNGEEGKALELINSFIVDHPSNAVAHRAKSMAFAACGDYQKAVDSMRVAINLAKSKEPFHYLEIGEYLLETGSFDEACEVLTTAIDLITASQEAYALTSALIARAVASFKTNKLDLVRSDLQAIDDETSIYCAGELWTKKKIIDQINGVKLD